MPAFGDRLSDEQIADVIAYLDTLPPGSRNFGPEMTEPGGMMPDNRMMDRMDVLLAVVLIVLVAVLILVVVLLVNQPRRQVLGNGESPREILDRRYAAGGLSGSSIGRPARTSTTDAVMRLHATGMRRMCCP
jgi:uncharacterized membrane protein